MIRRRAAGHPHQEHPMKYMLMIYGNQELWESFAPEDHATVVAETEALHDELRATGEYLCAFGVGDQALAKTVHLEAGTPVVSDGPYIETKEYLGSFDIIDVDSYERAVEIAAAVPFAKYGSVEIRPLMDESASNE
jgi:hypothetical protein